MKETLACIRDIAIALLIAAIVLFFFRPIIVQQSSMEPTFNSGDYVIVSKQSYKMFGDIEYGNVIIFKSSLVDENGKEKNLIKRVIGLPGDTIKVVDGYVIRNEETIHEEGYIAEQGMSGDMEEIVVGEGKVFVMGDNRAVSQDSRSDSVGQIDQENIVGKVVLRVFPFNSIRTFG